MIMSTSTGCPRAGMHPAQTSAGGNGGSTHLLVELVDVVVGLVLRLDEGGVLLNFLRRRHLASRALIMSAVPTAHTQSKRDEDSRCS